MKKIQSWIRRLVIWAIDEDLQAVGGHCFHLTNELQVMREDLIVHVADEISQVSGAIGGVLEDVRDELEDLKGEIEDKINTDVVDSICAEVEARLNLKIDSVAKSFREIEIELHQKSS